MYRARVVHPFVRKTEPTPDAQTETLWSLFVAIGEHWALGDDSDQYRLRFLTFMENRVNVNPLYRDSYRDGAGLIDDLVRRMGAKAAFEKIFTDKPRIPPTGTPATPLEALQRFVVNEFIAFRLAVGSFKTFGAINYPGYPAGANVADQPIPYRSKDRV
jgi:hypothetical protein